MVGKAADMLRLAIVISMYAKIHHSIIVSMTPTVMLVRLYHIGIWVTECISLEV